LPVFVLLQVGAARTLRASQSSAIHIRRVDVCRLCGGGQNGGATSASPAHEPVFGSVSGFNLAALLRGLKEGPRTLGRASCAAYWAARSAANRHQAVIRRQLNQIPVVHLTHSSNSLGRPKMPDQAAGDEI